MLTFLEETIQKLTYQYEDISSLKIIVPSKRAGGFLKNYLRKESKITTFVPTILSIEEFIQEISQLAIIDSTELIFKSYEAYLQTTSFSEKEDFESYTSWASTLLNDFNEVDRYLLDPKQFFSYLGSIKTLEKWNVKGEQTELIKNYLSFWDSLLDFYNTLIKALEKEEIGHQGLVYRKASEKIETYIKQQQGTPHVFIGFNALNNAEQHIIQKILEDHISSIFWDADSHFHEDTKHSASLFLRRYLKEWTYFQKNKPQFIASNYSQEKSFKVIEVQKNIGQAKYVGEILSEYDAEKLANTAVVLADEKLLMPILHSLPPNVTSVNITMGVSLKTFPITTFFELLLTQHTRSNDLIYYKDIFALLYHPTASLLVSDRKKIISEINKTNSTHLSEAHMYEITNIDDLEIIRLLFGDWKDRSEIALEKCLHIIELLKESLTITTVEKAALYQLLEIFERISALNKTYSHLKSIKTIQGLFSELIASATLDFKGDAYEGLQIMGILETRVLDFKNIIMTSVNEGVLPTGKSNASFITYDLKQTFKLPLYTEKDAIYTYHFYRLLHRTKEIALVYNSHSEGLHTGEKSRFLLQLDLEKHPNHSLQKTIITPKISIAPTTLKTIAKTEAVGKRLQEIASKKFSPSALTSYIRNPMDFYFQKILGVQEADLVEETVAANTLGTIVHESLETLYTPFLGKFIFEKELKERMAQIDTIVLEQYRKHFNSNGAIKGKNLLIFEVAKRYVYNFLRFEIHCVQNGDQIKILQLEKEMVVPIDIPSVGFQVNLGGNVDRVDECNGVLRIIDYKTGLVNQGELELVDWQDLTADYKYSKAFQVLAYATMMEHTFKDSYCEAGVISFKNLSSGFLKFGTKEAPRAQTKNQKITSETIDIFKNHLVELIIEICDLNIPFTEKEIT
ncbi:PD-(D/E)XK nuclease family protein [Jejudonia soesokkakensis]|uniref:PD-(D/E)XK nuclease family protein n=1 Tax=Jejudonia soesokkakensis TaxID=1323432 RepID=A0ABW2MMW9_9FLAO